MIAGNRQERRGQCVVALTGEGEIVLPAGAVQGDVSSVDDEVGAMRLHEIRDGPEVVHEPWLDAAQMRVRNLQHAVRAHRSSIAAVDGVRE